MTEISRLLSSTLGVAVAAKLFQTMSAKSDLLENVSVTVPDP